MANGVRFGNAVFRGGQGFSERDTTPDPFRRRRSSGGGGGGSSSAANAVKAAALKVEAAKKEAARKAAEDKKLKLEAEAKIAAVKTIKEKTLLAQQFLNERAGRKELSRILNFRSNIIRAGGNQQTTQSRDFETKEPLKVDRWKDKKGNMVQRITNQTTGLVRYETFAVPRSGGSARQTGILTTGDVNKIPGVKTIPGEPERLLVSLPNGRKVKISSSGKIVIGKELGGQRYVFQDGRLVSIGGTSQKARVVLTGVDKRGEADIKQLLKSKVVIPISVIKANVSKETLALKRQWTKQIAASTTRLQAAAARGDLDRLAQLQKKRNLTSAERAEWARLKKQAKRNFELAGEIVGKSVAISLINIGYGVPVLVQALRADPWETLKSLPTAALDGIKEDWRRATGSGIGAVTVAAEWIILAALFGLAGKAAGIPLRVLGKLAPKLVKSTRVSRFIGRSAKKAVPKSVKRAVTKVKVTVKGKVAKFKTKGELNAQLKMAKKLRKLARKKGRTLNIGDDEYVKAIDLMYDSTDSIARLKARQFMNRARKGGAKIGRSQEDDFIRAVQRHMKKQLESMQAFKDLKNAARLNRPSQIKLKKIGRLTSAKRMFERLGARVKKIPIPKKLSNIIKKVRKVSKKTGKVARKVKKKVRGRGRNIKASVKGKVAKFKSNREFSNQLRNARKIRKAARKKGRKVNIGDDEYVKAIDLLYDLTNGVSKLKARQFINKFKKAGGKISHGQEDDFIRAVQRHMKKQLESMQAFKDLKNAGRLNKPFQIRFRKLGKIETAKRMFGRLKSRVRNIPVPRRLSGVMKKVGKVSRKIGRTARKIKRRASPKRIKKRISINKARRVKIKAFKKTIRFQMDKAMKPRTVTIAQLNRAKSVGNMKKFIDDLFNEMGKRRKIDITTLQYRQLRNIMKKRMTRAIKNGNVKEINKFRDAAKKMIGDLNAKSTQPSVRITRVGGGKSRVIKKFKPDVPKGRYVEVKSGGQVLLQEVKQVAASKTRQVAQSRQAVKQVYKITSVTKTRISLKPLFRYAVFSLSTVAFGGALKSGQSFGPKSKSRQLSGAISGSKQDTKVLQAIGPKIGLSSAVTQSVRSAQKVRSLSKTKTIQKKKKIRIPIKIPNGFTEKKLSKGQMTYFVTTRRRGKVVRLFPSPLTMKDARDYLAYSIDNNLTKTAWFVPLGKSRNTVRPPKRISGYYTKVARKLRPFKIRQGKKKRLLNGYVEKRKYFQDTIGEKKQLKSTRMKAKMRKVVRRKPTKRGKIVKRKPVMRNVRRRKPMRRKMNPAQRKVMLRNLKRARAARRRR